MTKRIKRIAALTLAAVLLICVSFASLAEGTDEIFEENTVTVETEEVTEAAVETAAEEENPEEAEIAVEPETEEETETAVVTETTEEIAENADDGASAADEQTEAAEAVAEEETETAAEEEEEYIELDDSDKGYVDPELVSYYGLDVTEELKESSDAFLNGTEETVAEEAIIVTRAWIESEDEKKIYIGEPAVLLAKAEPELNGKVNWEIRDDRWEKDIWETIGTGKKLQLNVTETMADYQVRFVLEDGTVSKAFRLNAIEKPAEETAETEASEELTEDAAEETETAETTEEEIPDADAAEETETIETTEEETPDADAAEETEETAGEAAEENSEASEEIAEPAEEEVIGETDEETETVETTAEEIPDAAEETEEAAGETVEEENEVSEETAEIAAEDAAVETSEETDEATDETEDGEQEPETIRAWITANKDEANGSAVLLTANAEPEMAGVNTWQTRNALDEEEHWQKIGYGDEITVEITEENAYNLYRFVMQDGTISEEYRFTAEEAATEETEEEETAAEEIPEKELPELSELPELPEEPELPEDRSVSIVMSCDDEHPGFGSVIHFTAELNGYEDLEYTVQWITSTDNESWVELEGANSETMDVTVTKDNYQNYWRVIVTIEGYKDIQD